MRFVFLFLLLFPLLGKSQELAYIRPSVTPFYSNYVLLGINHLEGGFLAGATVKDRFSFGGYAGMNPNTSQNSYGAYIRGMFNPKDVF